MAREYQESIRKIVEQKREKARELMIGMQAEKEKFAKLNVEENIKSLKEFNQILLAKETKKVWIEKYKKKILKAGKYMK